MRSMKTQLPEDWREVLQNELDSPRFAELEKFVARERSEHTVYPPADEVFSAFRLTPYAAVEVVLLGQDPYHGRGQAHGLAFSVQPGVRVPPSLVNVFKELQRDLNADKPRDGCLVPWAERGVLLLNTVLTVREATPNSHAKHGWEHFTDTVIRKVSEKQEPVVFLLWGSHAQKKKALIDPSRHILLEAPHPSPLSPRSFSGSRPFSQANAELEKRGREPIDWSLPSA